LSLFNWSVLGSIKPKLEDKKSTSFKDAMKKRLRLKELQENKYPFPDKNLAGMLDNLLKKEISELPDLNGPKKLKNRQPKILSVS